MLPSIGIDFGTTNSVIAVCDAQGPARSLALGSGAAPVLRSVLAFWAEDQRGRQLLHHAAGPAGIAAYLEDPLDTRLILSMKTYLAQSSFVRTEIFGRRFTLEQLIGLFLRALAAAAGLGPEARLTVGRPVRFAGEQADDALGEARLRAAFAEGGLGPIDVAFEPEAAGYRFTRALDAPATVLIGDFGGGTSDFSLLRFEPGAARPVQALASVGVGIAGDRFDYRIIDHAIAPLLGRDDTYAIMGKRMPIPAAYYAGFARWHRLSLMRAPRTLRDIAEVARTADHPERLRTLVALIEQEQGYALYQAVSGLKATLSLETCARLRFQGAGLSLDREVSRAEFEEWIAPELRLLDATIGRALAAAGLEDAAVDRVFLTGGTAFVPAVRGLFERRFGPARIAGGGEFVSVAEGLALIGRDRAEAG